MPVNLSGRQISLLDRPGQSIQNMLAGDVDGVWKSMLSPESLGPQERDALLTKWGVKPDSFKARLLETVTNPFVLGTIMLTYAFPVPSARNLFKAKEGFDGMLAKIPGLRTFANARTIFKDTPVAEALDGIVEAKSEIWDRYMVARLGPAFDAFAAETGKAVSAREQAIIFNWLQKSHVKPLKGWEDIGVLMPGLDKAMTPAMRRLAGEVRGTLDDTLTHVWQNPENSKLLHRAVKNLRKAGYGDEALEQLVSLTERGGFDGIPDYMPLRAIRTEADIKHLRDAISATAADQDFQRSAQYSMMTFLGKEFYKRSGSMIPSMQELQLLGDLVDKKAYLRLSNSIRDKVVDGLADMGLSASSVKRLQQTGLSDLMAKGKGLVAEGERDLFVRGIAQHMPTQYSMQMEPVLQQYYHSVASTYAFTIKGHGPKIIGELNRARALGRVDARAAWRAKVLEENVIPTAMGKPSTRQAINAMAWDQWVGTAVAQFDRPSVRNLVGNDFADRMKGFYLANQGAFSLKGLSMMAASYFYLSTLGLSPGAAFRNQFQFVTMTGPLVGFNNAIRGQLDALEGATRYFEARMGREALSHADALKKAFPEFVESGLAGRAILDESLTRSFETAARVHKTAPETVSLAEKAQRAAMMMFTASETNVRLGAFYAGMRHAAADGITGAKALSHAADVVRKTQFIPGLAETPVVLQGTGALANPLLRQMLQFPARAAQYTLEGIGEFAAGNPARLFRQAAGAYVTVEIGDVLGLNLTDALVGSAMPMFTNVSDGTTPFAPLPVVPPAVALAGGIASTFAGDWETVHRQLPLLAPGGVGLSKMLGFIPSPSDVPQRAARWLGKKYADYGNMNPMTGRIPVYNAHGSLMGYYSPFEITKYAMGIRGGDIDETSQVAHQITKDADAMRATRQEYLDAIFTNDARKAAAVQMQYEKQFGHKLALTRAQIQQVQERRKMTIIERQLSTLPRAARPGYEEAAFAQPAARSYITGSYKPAGRVSGPPANYTNEMDPMSEFDPYAVSRYRHVPTATIP